MRSVVVVLPASTWAMMPMLRRFSSIGVVAAAACRGAAPETRKRANGGIRYPPRLVGPIAKPDSTPGDAVEFWGDPGVVSREESVSDVPETEESGGGNAPEKENHNDRQNTPGAPTGEK